MDASERVAALRQQDGPGRQGRGVAGASQPGASSLTLEERIRYQLYVSGERERLKRVLNERLTACGWKEQVKQLCREVVEQRGRDSLTPEEIVAAVRPIGRQTVPDAVKAQLLAEIKQLIMRL